jgi:hypothetical protein
MRTVNAHSFVIGPAVINTHTVMTRCMGNGMKGGWANNRVTSMDEFDKRLYELLFERHEYGWYQPGDTRDPY